MMHTLVGSDSGPGTRRQLRRIGGSVGVSGAALSVLLTAVAAVIVVGAALPASSSAAFTHVGQFSGQGSGSDQLSSPAKGEVRLSDGRLLVADSGNDRIQVFAPTPTGATAEAPLTDASLDGPHDVAIDQETGEVYVADADAIVRFDAAGVLDGTFAPLAMTGPIDFDESANELVVGDWATSTVRRFSRSGVPGVSFDGTDGSSVLGTILDLAVDSSGDVLVVDSTGSLGFLTLGFATSTVERYSAVGVYQAEIGSVEAAATVAVEPTTDRVLVGGNLADSYNFGSPLKVSAFAPSGAADESVELPIENGLVYSQVAGVALGAPGDRMYAITDFDAQDRVWGAISVQVYDNPASATIVVDPNVSEITGSTAKVDATVDPNGSPARWVFDLSTDGGANWKPAKSGSTSDSDDPEQVTATLVDLDALTDYLVRLRLPDAGAVSSEVSFSTPAGPPLVRSQAAVQVSQTGARLAGSVDPQAAETVYWFEYGTTPDYGSRIPAGAGAAVGDGNRWKVAIQDLTGLQPDTTYHFRLVAESANGTAQTEGRTFTTSEPTATEDDCPNAQIRAEQRSTHLADCRAYEQVSPPQKYNGGVVLGHRGSDDGNAVSFMMNTPLNAGQGGFPVESFVAYRDENGWVSDSASLPMRAEDRSAAGGIAGYAVDFTADFSKAFVNTNDPVSPDDRHPHANSWGITDGYDIYRTDIQGRTSEWISRPRPDATSALPAGRVVSYSGSTPDGTHAVFRSARALVAGVPEDLTPASFGSGRLYEWVDGTVRIVSVLPDGTDVEGEVALGPIQSTGVRHNDAISEDGRRIYWAQSLSADEKRDGYLYLREDGSVTRSVSKGQRASFIGATPDGARAYFYSQTPVGGAASGGLYRYDAESDDVELLAPVTDMVISNEDYRPLLSDVNERVYFFAKTQLTPDAPLGMNLYVWDDGELRHAAPVSQTTSPESSGLWDLRLRVTRDGRFAAFTTTKSLDPRHGEGTVGIYRYDTDTGEVVCASCGAPGTVSKGNSLFRSVINEYTVLMFPSNVQPRNMTDDGHVFFQSEDDLVAADVNGRDDVYEFDGQGVRLISSGKGISGSEISDNSDDGSSVFFLTPDSLTGHDTDGGMPDFYVARVNGGFSEPEPRPERCRGDACQGAAGTPPALPSIGSVWFGIDGNVPMLPDLGRAMVAVSKLKAVFGTAAKLKVRVPDAGRIRVVGRLFRRTGRSVSKAGTYTLKIALRPRAKRLLRRKKRMRVNARVWFRGKDGRAASKTINVTFNQPKSKRDTVKSWGR